MRRAGEEITLTATEFELLRFLMRNPRRVLSQGADPRPGLELRLRRPGQRRRALHLLPAQEDRRRPRADDPHDARRGLRAEAGRREAALLASLTSRLVVTAVALVAVVVAADRRRDDAGDAQLPVRTGSTSDVHVLAEPRSAPSGPRPSDPDRATRPAVHGRARPGCRAPLTARLGTGDQRRAWSAPRAGAAGRCRPTGAEQLDDVPADGASHGVTLPGLGDYRVDAPARDRRRRRSSPGCRPRDVDDADLQLIWWEVLLGLLGRRRRRRRRHLVVRRQLRPLHEVAATAHAVAELPLAVGRDRTLTERVPERPHRRAHRGRPGRRRPEHAARARRVLAGRRGTAASSRCGSSSPTPPTSCGRR